MSICQGGEYCMFFCGGWGICTVFSSVTYSYYVVSVGGFRPHGNSRAVAAVGSKSLIMRDEIYSTNKRGQQCYYV